MKLLQKIRRYRWYLLGRFKIRMQIAKKHAEGHSVRIILGAGITTSPDWISTDLPHFDITSKKDWGFLVAGVRIDNLLTEHVLEHLTDKDVQRVLVLAFKYLKPGGIIRNAVPDAYHPNEDYRKITRPPADGHLSSWNVDNLGLLLAQIGFKANWLEYYDKHGIYHSQQFDVVNGDIIRSKTLGIKNPEIKDYSSLIVDAIKLS